MAGTPPRREDLRIQPGEPFSFTTPILQADGTVLTSAGPAWGVAAQIRSVPLSPTIMHSFTTSVTAGIITVSATASDTANFQANWVSRRNSWDLVLTEPSGKRHTLATGWVYLYNNVTR